MSRQHCTICAWRATCNKRFSVSDAGARCPDFSRDVSVKDGEQLEQPDKVAKEQN